MISEYIAKHERLIIAVGILGLVLYIGTRWIDYRAKEAELVNNKAQAVAAQQAQIVSALTSQLQQAQQNSNAVVTQTSMQVAALQSQIASLQINLASQQSAVRTRPISEIALQWSTLIGLPVQNTDKGLLVDDSGARATVSQLIEIPILNEEIKTQTSELAEKDKAISAQADTIKASTSLVAGLNVQITDNGKACDARVNVVKAEARKGKRNYFIAGFIAGIATRVLGKF